MLLRISTTVLEAMMMTHTDKKSYIRECEGGWGVGGRGVLE